MEPEPLGAGSPGGAPARVHGCVDERSAHHVAGWVLDEADPARPIPYEVVLQVPGGERVLAQGLADDWNVYLATSRTGTGPHAFRVLFGEAVADPELVSVRIPATGTSLPFAPALRERFQPISHLALDIVNNCNLRCPFCLYDYAETRATRFMAEDTFRSALRLLPYVTEGNFWLSCAHEPTLHPQLLHFIDMVPREYRDRLMFTTNLAKRMPDAYFGHLGGTGIHNLNVSVESLDPEIYERLRKGARFRIFQENWAKLLLALRSGSAPPRLRYIVMAYQSNVAEIPSLVETLLEEKEAWQVEIRYTFDLPHIAPAFRAAAYLGPDEWVWLFDQLAHHDPSRVLLLPPPSAPPEADTPVPMPPQHRPSYPLGMRMEWDGRLLVVSTVGGADGKPNNVVDLDANVLDIADPAHMLAELIR